MTLFGGCCTQVLVAVAEMILLIVCEQLSYVPY